MRTKLIAILFATLFSACVVGGSAPPDPQPSPPSSSGGGGGGGGGGTTTPPGPGSGSGSGSDVGSGSGSGGLAGDCLSQVNQNGTSYQISCTGISATEVSCQCQLNGALVKTCTQAADTACTFDNNPNDNCCGFAD